MDEKGAILRSNGKRREMDESVIKLALRVQELVESGYQGSLEVVFDKRGVHGWHKHEFERVEEKK